MALMVATVAWPSSTDAADIAYAWADRESDPFSYVANEQYAYTSSDHIKVTREGVGYYVVDFGVLLGVGGNVQVSMYGSDTGHCSLRFWTHSRAHVQCYDILRRPADRKFSILAINAEPSDAGDLIYAWLDRSSAPSPYQPSASYRFDNGTLRVDNDSPGDYQPFWSPGLRAATLVTPYGSSANCRHIDGSSTRTWFRCEAPTRASLLLVADSFPGTSFARWNRSTGSVSGWTSDGSAQSATRVRTGVVRIRVGPEAAVGGHVHASSFLDGGDCHVASWSSGTATVHCDRDGVPVDSDIMVFAIRR